MHYLKEEDIFAATPHPGQLPPSRLPPSRPRHSQRPDIPFTQKIQFPDVFLGAGLRMPESVPPAPATWAIMSAFETFRNAETEQDAQQALFRSRQNAWESLRETERYLAAKDRPMAEVSFANTLFLTTVFKTLATLNNAPADLARAQLILTQTIPAFYETLRSFRTPPRPPRAPRPKTPIPLTEEELERQKRKLEKEEEERQEKIRAIEEHELEFDPDARWFGYHVKIGQDRPDVAQKLLTQARIAINEATELFSQGDAESANEKLAKALRATTVAQRITNDKKILEDAASVDRLAMLFRTHSGLPGISARGFLTEEELMGYLFG